MIERRYFSLILQNVFENDRLFLSDLEIQGAISFQFIKIFLVPIEVVDLHYFRNLRQISLQILSESERSNYFYSPWNHPKPKDFLIISGGDKLIISSKFT